MKKRILLLMLIMCLLMSFSLGSYASSMENPIEKKF